MAWGYSLEAVLGELRAPVGEWLRESVLAGARSAPPPSLYPLELGAGVAALCACSCGSGSESGGLGPRVASPGTAPPEERPGPLPPPSGHTRCCSTNGTHHPGLVRKMALFLEGSALRTLPGTEWSGLVAGPPGVPRNG